MTRQLELISPLIYLFPLEVVMQFNGHRAKKRGVKQSESSRSAPATIRRITREDEQARSNGWKMMSLMLSAEAEQMV